MAAAGLTEPRCASERGLAMGDGCPAERRFTVGDSGKSVARCLHGARVLEVRIHLPPADSPSLSGFRLGCWKAWVFRQCGEGGQAARSAETHMSSNIALRAR